MSVIKRQADERREKGRRRRRKQRHEVTWKDVDDDTIRRLISLAEHYDGAIRFGRSRDRSVFSLGFYIGEDRFTEWISGSDDPLEEIDRIITEIEEDYKLDSQDD